MDPFHPAPCHPIRENPIQEGRVPGVGPRIVLPRYSVAHSSMELAELEQALRRVPGSRGGWELEQLRPEGRGPTTADVRTRACLHSQDFLCIYI